MPMILILISVSLPLVMTAGAIAVIHQMRERERQVEAASKWRDDSLDDWRKERDAVRETERDLRVTEREDALAAGHEEESAQPVQQQRLGG